jgi:hypothetical protein
MTLPRRILEEGTPFERDVLASAQLDVGSDQGLKRAIAVMGVGAAVGSAATSTATAGTAAGASSGATAGAAASKALFLGAGAGAFVKWIGLGVVVVGAVTAASAHSTRHALPATIGVPPSLQATTKEATSPTPAGKLSPEIAPLPLSPALSGLGSGPAAPSLGAPWAGSKQPADLAAPRPALPGTGDMTSSRAPSRSASAAPLAPEAEPSPPAPDTPPAQPPAVNDTPRASSLYAEIAALERVRAALERRDAPGALQLLDAHDREFPSSALADEATVLRVDALAKQGDLAGAAALSRRFLVARPASPHAPHLRDVIEGMHNP